MKKQIIFYAIFITACLMVGGCGTSKRDRQKSVDRSELELSSIQSDSSKGSVIQGSKINAVVKEYLTTENTELNLKPIDPSRPATVKDEPLPCGGRKITTENGELTLSENKTESKRQDSIQTAQFFKQQWENYLQNAIEVDQELDNKDLELHKENDRGMPWGWIAGVAAVLGSLGLWLTYKRTGGK